MPCESWLSLGLCQHLLFLVPSHSVCQADACAKASGPGKHSSLVKPLVWERMKSVPKTLHLLSVWSLPFAVSVFTAECSGLLLLGGHAAHYTDDYCSSLPAGSSFDWFGALEPGAAKHFQSHRALQLLDVS